MLSVHMMLWGCTNAQLVQVLEALLMLKNLFWSWTCHLPHCVFFMVVSLISGYSISYKASILQLVNSDRQQRNTIVHRFALLETWSVKRHAEKAQYITACLRHRVAVLACHQLRTFEELWNEKYNKGGFRLSRFQSYIKEECCSNMKCVASLKNPLRVFRKKNIRGDARRSYTCPRPNVFIKYCRASQLNMGIQSFSNHFGLFLFTFYTESWLFSVTGLWTPLKAFSHLARELSEAGSKGEAF